MDERRMAPTVSVALCTYEGERFVAEQVRSILEQTRPASELVIADDGSTDGTLGVIEATVADYRSKHPDAVPQIRVLSGPPPRGVAANFERALRACTGDLVALSDQDDVWHPERLERMVAAFEAMPDATLLHSDARLVDATGADLGRTLFAELGITPAERAEVASGRGFDALLRRNIATGATTMLRVSVRDAALPIPPGWLHDEWLAVVAAATGRTAILDEALTDYRQHGGNQIGAEQRTLGVKLGRLREPRGPRNARLLERARSMAARLADLDGVGDDKRAAAKAKLSHESHRSALPARRIARVGRVLLAARRGDYARFGNGAQDVLRDLVQPVS
ncbi:MAG: glycosyltransferase family 2 protein [Pseudolysinimonas sp.]